MKIAGIIAEYNPFHTGHAYHIAETRRRSGADGIAVIMSGNFVQRGGPAIADKWTRARAAVAGGADVVLELPVYYAHAPAQLFAAGAVESLLASGCIDVLSFGAETPDIVELARATLDREEEIEQLLQAMLSPDTAYPAAYAEAVRRVCGVGASVLKNPNNMLALEYVKALARAKSDIEPLCIERVGAGYHDAEEKDGFASATALRHKIEKGTGDWEQYVPEAVRNIYNEAKRQGRFPVTAAQFEAALLSILRRLPAKSITQISDMPHGFGGRIAQAAGQATSIEALLALCAVKQYTAARVRRLVWSSFLGLPQLGYEKKPTYLRVLAMNETGKAILKRMKETSRLPIVTKAADFEADALFGLDVCATDLYFASAGAAANRSGGADYTTSPIIL